METDRVLIIRRRNVIRGWCPACACEVDMVSLEEAGVITGTSPMTVRDNRQAQAWHFCESSDGAPLVCLESLLKSM